jgi:hypothetical protein
VDELLAAVSLQDDHPGANSMKILPEFMDIKCCLQVSKNRFLSFIVLCKRFAPTLLVTLEYI